jgi:hypothetical protein
MSADLSKRAEGTCDLCAREYVTPWFAPSDVWNRVNGSPNGMLCPECFMREGNRVLGPQIWKVLPDVESVSDPNERFFVKATVTAYVEARDREKAMQELCDRLAPGVPDEYEINAVNAVRQP